MKILVTGGNGLCGSAIREESAQYDYDCFFSTSEYDLRDKKRVDELFAMVQPDVVVHTAAKVGGIGGNEAMHEEFFYDNILMNANLIRACAENRIKKLFAFSSVCVFPDDLSILEEDRMHNGPVFESNFAYGYAKRMVDVHIRAAEKQYGISNWCSIIPGNIFGKNDMFSIEYGHIIPALMHKLYLAKLNNSPFTIWGDGKSLREFIYVNDLARIILDLIPVTNIPNKIIVAGRQENSIKEIVEMLVDISKFDGIINWDLSKPNGQRNRPSSKKVIDSLLPTFDYSDIYDSLKITWEWFEDNYPNIRTRYLH